MEDYNGYETVKERLILAGISELQTHSIEDLSLRKISKICNVSCAAPYKHFENKQDFINQIILYISNQWEKLKIQVIEAFSNDSKTQVIEVSIAYIKFCMANPTFTNVMNMKSSHSKSNSYLIENDGIIRKYCENKFTDKEVCENKIYIINSLIYGTVNMINSGIIDNSSNVIDRIRKILNAEL